MRGRCAGLLAVAVALAASVACLGPPLEPLRIGMNVWPTYELLYLAREKGVFADEGLEVELVDFSSYTGVLRAYHEGNIDGFLATLNEVQVKENFQDPPAVVLVADYSFGGDALVARDGIASLADLRGRRIAYEESALGSYVLERALEAAGLRNDEVMPINRLSDEGEADFRRRKVDAVITYEPGVGKLMREGGARVLFTSRDIPGEIVDVLALRRSVIDQRTDESRRLLRSWFRARDLLRDNPADAAMLMARRERLEVGDFLEALNGTHIPDLRENLELLGTKEQPGPLHETADRLGRFLVRRGLARRAASGSELFSPGLLESL